MNSDSECLQKLKWELVLKFHWQPSLSSQQTWRSIQQESLPRGEYSSEELRILEGGEGEELAQTDQRDTVTRKHMHVYTPWRSYRSGGDQQSDINFFTGQKTLQGVEIIHINVKINDCTHLFGGPTGQVVISSQN